MKVPESYFKYSMEIGVQKVLTCVSVSLKFVFVWEKVKHVYYINHVSNKTFVDFLF